MLSATSPSKLWSLGRSLAEKLEKCWQIRVGGKKCAAKMVEGALRAEGMFGGMMELTALDQKHAPAKVGFVVAS